MMTVSVRTNIQAIRKSLDDVVKRQLPFAVAKALTLTAKDTQGLLATALPRQLDHPTPFTMKAFAIKPATKRLLLAKVVIKPAQWKYLQYQIEGGVRKPAVRAILLPKALRLNQYGNMPRAAIKKLLAKSNVFSGTVDGTPGIYQRKGKGVQLLVAYRDEAKYRKRYPFQQIGVHSVSKVFDKRFREALAAALATAR